MANPKSKVPKDRNIVVYPFHGLLPVTCAANTWAQSMNPTAISISRLVQAAQQFQNYRLRSLKFRAWSSTTALAAGTNLHTYAGWFPGQTLSLTSISEFENRSFMVHSQNFLCPATWCKVPKTDLGGQFPWYKTDLSASIDANEEEVGFIKIYCSTTAALVVLLEIQGIYEFKDPIDNTLGLTTTLVERERARLEKILGVPPGMKLYTVPELPAPNTPSTGIQAKSLPK